MNHKPSPSQPKQSAWERLISRICYSVLFKLVPRKTKFALIHRFNLWSSDESISGPGSELARTLQIRQFLEWFLPQYEVKSVLDIPCGDFNWMKTVDLSGIRYFGGDIVPMMIAKNEEAFGSENVKFGLVDIIADPLPRSDLVIVRDLFIHFSPGNVKAAIQNLISSKSTYLLTTTWPDTTVNQTIRDGYNTNINLQIAPYFFPEPLHLIEEMRDSNGERNCMAVWRVDAMCV